MSSVIVKTNNVPRPLIQWDELTDKEKKENDWARRYPDTRFFRYKGYCYSEDDFMYCDPDIWTQWDGIHSDTFFSGVLIRWPEDMSADEIIVGRFCAVD